ncbi:Ubiquitin-conjugating enzyme E2 4 [Irineochytrium annulatum]|nr:Ubiquitin-conjugating enzyme E2 4 [Irineochytrium annulatum]
MTPPPSRFPFEQELGDLMQNPSNSFSAGPSGDDLFNWEARLIGPVGIRYVIPCSIKLTLCTAMQPSSAYSGGVFKVLLELSTDYPFKPPKVKFGTKIYHPNVDDDGSICIGVLKPDVWKPSNRIADVLNSLVLILEQPIPEDAINTSVAEVFNSNRQKFLKTASDWVKKHASS